LTSVFAVRRGGPRPGGGWWVVFFLLPPLRGPLRRPLSPRSPHPPAAPPRAPPPPRRQPHPPRAIVRAHARTLQRPHGRRHGRCRAGVPSKGTMFPYRDENETIRTPYTTFVLVGLNRAEE